MNGTLVINRKTRKCKLFVRSKNEMIGCIVKAKDSANVKDGSFSGEIELREIKFYELENDAEYINARILLPQSETTPEGDLLKKEVVAYIQPIEDTDVLVLEGIYTGNAQLDFNKSKEARSGLFTGTILIDDLPVSRPETPFNKEVESDIELDTDKLAELTEEREIILANNNGIYVRKHQTHTLIEETKKAVKAVDERKAEELAATPTETKGKGSEDEEDSELAKLIAQDTAEKVQKLINLGMELDKDGLHYKGAKTTLHVTEEEVGKMSKNQYKKLRTNLLAAKSETNKILKQRAKVQQEAEKAIHSGSDKSSGQDKTPAIKDEAGIIDLPAEEDTMEFSDPPVVEKPDKPILTFKDRNAEKFPVGKIKDYPKGCVVATPIKREGRNSILIIGAPKETFYKGHFLVFGTKDTANFIMNKLKSIPVYQPSADEMKIYDCKAIIPSAGDMECIYVENGQQFMQCAFPPEEQLDEDKKKEALKAQLANA